MLLLLTWITTTQQKFPHMEGWAGSDDAARSCRRLKREFRKPLEKQRIICIVAALISHDNLVSSNAPNTATTSTGCYVSDLNALLCGASLDNLRDLVQTVGASILRQRQAAQAKALAMTLLTGFNDEHYTFFSYPSADTYVSFVCFPFHTSGFPTHSVPFNNIPANDGCHRENHVD